MINMYTQLEAAPLSHLIASVNDNDTRLTVPAAPESGEIDRPIPYSVRERTAANLKECRRLYGGIREASQHLAALEQAHAQGLPKMVMRQLVGRPRWMRRCVGSVWKRREACYDVADRGRLVQYDSATKTVSALPRRGKLYEALALSLDWSTEGDGVLRVLAFAPQGTLIVRIPFEV